MHGLVFTELEKFVTRMQGAEQWQRVLDQAQMKHQVFVAVGTYPDADLLKLVQAATVVTKKPASQLLEGFGEFITPTLFSMYRTVILAEWRSLDLIENTEQVIHTVVRSRGGSPPVLSTKRVDATHLTVSYGSQRKLCALARGIIRGIAKHYGEQILIAEPQCMLAGAKSCRLDLALGALPAVKTALPRSGKH
jgi:hypothetical protein